MHNFTADGGPSINLPAHFCLLTDLPIQSMRIALRARSPRPSDLAKVWDYLGLSFKNSSKATVRLNRSRDGGHQDLSYLYKSVF
jgi:hypothetical protein